jgi:Uma2 family endonuclease
LRWLTPPLYAQSGVGEYWLVDVTAGVIEVYRSPSPSGYASLTKHGAGETITILAFGDVSVGVDDVLA